MFRVLHRRPQIDLLKLPAVELALNKWLPRNPVVVLLLLLLASSARRTKVLERKLEENRYIISHLLFDVHH